MKNESSFVQTVQTLDHHNHNEPRAHTLYIQSRFLHWNPYKKALTKHTISISRVRSFLTEKLIGLTVCLKLYNVLSPPQDSFHVSFRCSPFIFRLLFFDLASSNFDLLNQSSGVLML